MNGRAVQQGALAACGGKTFLQRRIEHHAGDGAALFDDAGADGEMRPALHEGDGTVNRIHHKDAPGGKTGGIIQTFLRQPAIIGPGAAERVFEVGVNRLISFGDRAAARFAPAPEFAQEEFARDFPGLAHRGFEQR